MLNTLRLSLVKLSAELPTYSSNADPLRNLSFENDYITGRAWSIFQDIIRSWYGLCMVIGSAGFILTLMTAAIGLMVTGRSPRARAEFKEVVFFKVMTVSTLMLVVFFFGVIGQIINGTVGV